jgi:sensor c-di-GMP phosphodiesterase-like protein
MLRPLVVVGLFLVLISQLVIADDTLVGPTSTANGQPVSVVDNRLVSAEILKQMKTMKDDVIAAANANNDANVAILDQRSQQMLADTRQRVIIGGIGAILVANAIVALFMIRTWRRYSYEYYLEKQLKQRDKVIETAKEEYSQALAQYQQQSWSPQQPQQTLSMQVGQTEAMNMTQMNAWQMQPAYQGSWAPPKETQQATQSQAPLFNQNQGGGYQ